MIELSTPKLGGGWVPEAPCWAHEMKKLILGTVLGGGDNRNRVGLDPEKCILGCPSYWVIGMRLTIEPSTPKLGGVGT